MTQDAPNASDAAPHAGSGPASMGWAQLLEDWVTIWQSEMAGLAVDREVQEALSRMGDAATAQVRMAGLLARRDPSAERASGPAGADAAARAATADAASDGKDAVIDQLLARVAELERRLGPSPADGPAGTGTR